jgi:IS30 family transposase
MNESFLNVKQLKKNRIRIFVSHVYTGLAKNATSDIIGLIQQYLINLIYLRKLSDEMIRQIENKLYNCARKFLQQKNPLQVFWQQLNKINISYLKLESGIL